MKVKRTRDEINFATVAATQVPIVAGAFFLAHNKYKAHGVWPFLVYAGIIIGFSFVFYVYLSLAKKEHNPRP